MSKHLAWCASFLLTLATVSVTARTAAGLEAGAPSHDPGDHDMVATDAWPPPGESPSSALSACTQGLAVGVPYEVLIGGAQAGAAHYIHRGGNGLSTTGAQWLDQNLLGGGAAVGELFGATLIGGDFDGDGCGDLAIGVPGENATSGAVHVVYGGSGGLNPGRRQWFTQATLGLSIESTDAFGSSLSAGDFDGDGYDDLAVGSPGEDVGTVVAAGGFSVIYGGPAGLSVTGCQWFDQNTVGLFPEPDDSFGRHSGTGDFDGDGYDDLAVSAPWESVGTFEYAGGFAVVYGGPGGLTTSGFQWFDQGVLGLTVEAWDEFADGGFAVGDFDGDGFDDLAVGAPQEGVSGVPHAGGTSIVYGGSGGLSVAGRQWFDQNTLGLGMQERDYFGFALASADMDGDGYDDLAIGVPGENFGGVDDAGQVDVLFGGPSGLSTAGGVYFDQSILGLTPEQGDSFGRSLAAGDFDGDRYADLAIGVPIEGVTGAPEAGGVHVLYGDATGHFLRLRQWFDQNLPNLGDTPEPGDRFGWSLAVVTSPLLFRDGFESGNTSAWSGSLP